MSISSSGAVVVGAGLSGNGTAGSPLTNAGVTSVATGNGLIGGPITSSGSVALDVYTGTTQNNTSYPIGSTVWVLANAGSVNSTQTVWSPPTGASPRFGTGSQGSGSGVLAGTWRWRGSTGFNCTELGGLVQRVA